MENSLDPRLVKGNIVVYDQGSSPRIAKGLVVKKAGGVRIILANEISNYLIVPGVNILAAWTDAVGPIDLD
ncbi:hypothetical protein AHAS_Ahas11G0259500 [Arachis hypogaea]